MMPLLDYKHLPALLFIIVCCFFSCNIEEKDKEWICIVSTYTEGTESKGIYTYAINMKSKQVSPLHYALEKVENPSYICIDKLKRNIYAVSETTMFRGKESGSIAHYTIEEDFSLSLVNQISSMGTSPCYLSLTNNGEQLLVANYTSGTNATFKLNRRNGKINNLYSNSHRLSGGGPDSIRQQSSHAHYILESPHHSSIVYAVDLGADKIITYQLNEDTLSVLREKKCTPGSGPRHMAFHPSLPLCYTANELASSVTTYVINDDATLDSIHNISTIPANYANRNYPSGIAVHPNGKKVYSLNRGQDAVAVFNVNHNNGKLAFHRYVNTLGHWPRSLTISPDGHLLFIANQKSNNIAVYGVDSQSGEILEENVMELAVPAPSHIVLIEK